MNYPSRNDETLGHPGWNQSPSCLSADLTTNQDLNGITNTRDHQEDRDAAEAKDSPIRRSSIVDGAQRLPTEDKSVAAAKCQAVPAFGFQPPSNRIVTSASPGWFPRGQKFWAALVKFVRFIGPGFLIAVAYIDPGNYATDVAAGAVTEYSLLFIVLMSNCFAIFLQSLCIKLGSVTGRNLAEMCREHLPRWLTITLYVLAEAAIIATDIAEVSSNLDASWTSNSLTFFRSLDPLSL